MPTSQAWLLSCTPGLKLRLPAAQVWLSSWSVLTVRNVAFIIQSAAFSAEHLESRVGAFVGSAARLLEAMPQEEFASQASMSCVLAAPLSLPAIWRELSV